MTSYTVASGDNLWNIIKNQYSGKIKSNSEIQTAVNEIAKVNDISNPNLIHTGDKLNLPSYESIFGTSEKTESTASSEKTEAEQTSSTYDSLVNWLKRGFAKKSEDKTGDVKGFSFLKSNVSTNSDNFEKAWAEGAESIASSNIKASDADNDNALSYDEYYDQEIEKYDEIYKEQGLTYSLDKNSNTKDYMKKQFDALDADGSGKLEQNELSAYYAASDLLDGEKDGKISFSSFSKLDLTSSVFQTEFKDTIEKFA